MKFSINAARRLPNLPDDHICSRVHGHTFDIAVHVTGEVDVASGWVMDFSAIQAPVDEMKSRLEHRYLNEIEGLENPTSENLAIWIWHHLCLAVPQLSKIVIAEGHDYGCIYHGPSS